MLKLTRENFNKAKSYIKKTARPLEKSLFKYYFENGSLEEVLMELSKYQNDDGGFGNCIESDVRLKVSNPLATSVAFQILTKLEVNSKNNMVKKGIDYLVKNYQPRFKGWIFFPPEVDTVPRAIWWNYEENEKNIYTANPSAEIVGYLARYRELVPEKIFLEASKVAIEFLDNNIDNLSMHEIFCYQRMADAYMKKDIYEKLKLRMRKVIDFNTNNWTGYATRPLSFISSPEEELMDIISSEELNINLDYIIKEQLEEGAWPATWSWGRYEEEWKHAEAEWRGHITVNNLCILKNFNRIEME